MKSISIALTAFTGSFADVQVREYPTHNVLVFIDEDGNETFVSPPKEGDALTHVSFTDSVDDILASIEEHMDELDVLIGHKPVTNIETGEVTYTGAKTHTLIDHREFVNDFSDKQHEVTALKKFLKKA